ncbi:uncharacterized protein LJ206_003665 isoform 1-T1 [Theristicus caerulescens]
MRCQGSSCVRTWFKMLQLSKRSGPGVTAASLTASEGRGDIDYIGIRRYSGTLGRSYLGKPGWFFISKEAKLFGNGKTGIKYSPSEEHALLQALCREEELPIWVEALGHKTIQRRKLLGMVRTLKLHAENGWPSDCNMDPK